MYDLTNFGLRDMTECSATLRKLGTGADSLTVVAERVVRFFYDEFRQIDGTTSCALVRFFKTQRYDRLDSELQQFALRMMGRHPESDNIFCLLLMATAGDDANWNMVEKSQQHRAIPLGSERMVEQSPMISQLIKQFGIDVATVLQPNPQFLLDIEQTTFNVFHVSEARGSPYVPAQNQFVIPHAIQSVLGFGGMLPTGELFAVILFSKLQIPRETAKLFETLALSIKISILPFVNGTLT